MAYSYKLAVIIPCWNCAKDIAVMLDCILKQTFKDWQVFCIDDQSSDTTFDVLKDYASRDNRIHAIIRDRNPKGAQTCRNLGFDMAEGAEYVIWLDADDLIAPYCFEQRVLYMDSHQELDFGVFPAQTFRNSINDNLKRGYGFPIFEDDLEAILSWVLPMVGWTNIYRRVSLIENQHRWDERVWSLQDSDFNIQSLLIGLKYDYAYKENAKVDYFYRAAGGLSKKISVHYESHLYLLNKVLNSFSREKKTAYWDALLTYCLRFAMVFHTNRKYFNSFLKIPFVREDKWFYYRLLIWRCFGYRLTYRIFFRKLLGGVLAKENLRTNSLQKEFDKMTPITNH